MFKARLIFDRVAAAVSGVAGSKSSDKPKKVSTASKPSASTNTTVACTTSKASKSLITMNKKVSIIPSSSSQSLTTKINAQGTFSMTLSVCPPILVQTVVALLKSKRDDSQNRFHTNIEDKFITQGGTTVGVTIQHHEHTLAEAKEQANKQMLDQTRAMKTHFEQLIAERDSHRLMAEVAREEEERLGRMQAEITELRAQLANNALEKTKLALVLQSFRDNVTSMGETCQQYKSHAERLEEELKAAYAVTKEFEKFKSAVEAKHKKIRRIMGEGQVAAQKTRARIGPTSHANEEQAQHTEHRKQQLSANEGGNDSADNTAKYCARDGLSLSATNTKQPADVSSLGPTARPDRDESAGSLREQKEASLESGEGESEGSDSVSQVDEPSESLPGQEESSGGTKRKTPRPGPRINGPGGRHHKGRARHQAFATKWNGV